MVHQPPRAKEIMEDLDRYIIDSLVDRIQLIESKLIEFERIYAEWNGFVTKETLKARADAMTAKNKQGIDRHYIYQRFKELETSFKGFLKWNNEQKEYKSKYKYTKS